MQECYVYMIRSGESVKRPVKIGMAEDPKRRIKELQTGNPEILYFVMIIKCKSRKHARELERTLHEQLCSVNVLGEWYNVNKQKLYKALKRLSRHEGFQQIELHNTKSVVSKERDMLRTERRKSESLRRHVDEAELAASKRRKQLSAIRMHVTENGMMTHKEFNNVIKSIDGDIEK